MIMHVLQYAGIKFDYMAGAMADGFENSVKISDDAEIAVFEGDEYLTSPLEKTPKFHHYYPHIAIITGIAWDHMNVFPTFENYCEQFQIFADRLEKDGSLIWFYDDDEVRKIAHNLRPDIESLPYRGFEHKIENGITSLLWVGEEYPLSVFGKHNLQNMKAAFEACRRVGVKKYQFFKGIRNFKGAHKRLQLMGQRGGSFVYLDFAHSPSKVQATLHSVKEQFEGKKIVAFFELHTFSSLNKDFLPQYAGTLDVADKAFVYYSPEVVEHKKLEHISVKEVGKFFKNKKLKVLTTAEELQDEIPTLVGENTVYLFMTSGTFGGTDLQAVTKQLLY